MTTHRLAIIPGDGVGREVVPEGLKCGAAAAEVTGSFDIDTVDYPWSCEYYAQHGVMMDGDAIDRMRDSDAIYLGAIGFPGVPDHVSLWGMLLPIRQRLRPVHQPAADRCSGASTGRCATGAPRTSTSSASARTPRASTAASAAGSGRARPMRSSPRPRSSRARAPSGSSATRSTSRMKRKQHARERAPSRTR